MRIMVGYWRGSSEKLPRDRHAVYGILGQNGTFRVKVVRETRYGRYVDGNFPSGAGALWIRYNDVKLEPLIKNLSRPELKEYCRLRQCQIDAGETVAERNANELCAADEARFRDTATVPTHHLHHAPMTGSSCPHLDDDGAAGETVCSCALRCWLRRALAGARPARQSLSDMEAGSSGSSGLTTNSDSCGSIPRGMQGVAPESRSTSLRTSSVLTTFGPVRSSCGYELGPPRMRKFTAASSTSARRPGCFRKASCRKALSLLLTARTLLSIVCLPSHLLFKTKKTSGGSFCLFSGMLDVCSHICCSFALFCVRV